MTKLAALTDEQIRDLEDRIVRGWVVRREQWVALIAMARERNALVSQRTEAQAVAAQTYG